MVHTKQWGEVLETHMYKVIKIYTIMYVLFC